MVYRLTVFISLLLSLAVSSVVAKPTVVDIDDLRSNDQQRQAALIITQVMERFHYRKPSLDDPMSQAIFDRYLESLDPNRSFFSEADIARFAAYRDEMDDSLRSGRLKPAFRIFRRFRELVELRAAYAVDVLENHKFDFARDETYTFDRSDAEWLPDAEALDDLWRRRVKNDILSLRLSGDEGEEVIKTLTKRYEGIARRVAQMDAEDVFQAFVNAYTLSVEPHTSYMSPRLSENFDIGMRLSLQGIGAVLRSDNEFTEVQSTVPGDPPNGAASYAVAIGLSGSVKATTARWKTSSAGACRMSWI